MGLQLVKKGTTDEFSFDGSGSDPVDVGTVNLDDTGTPPTVDSSIVNVEILATTFDYTGLGMSIVTEEAGVDYQLSLDGVVFTDTISPIDMDATGADVRQDVWIMTVVDNDGSVAAGDHTGADVRLVATENQ